MRSVTLLILSIHVFFLSSPIAHAGNKGKVSQIISACSRWLTGEKVFPIFTQEETTPNIFHLTYVVDGVTHKVNYRPGDSITFHLQPSEMDAYRIWLARRDGVGFGYTPKIIEGIAQEDGSIRYSKNLDKVLVDGDGKINFSVERIFSPLTTGTIHY